MDDGVQGYEEGVIELYLNKFANDGIDYFFNKLLPYCILTFYSSNVTYFFSFSGFIRPMRAKKKDRLLSARLLPARCRSCAVDVGVYATGVEAGSAVLCTTF